MFPFAVLSPFFSGKLDFGAVEQQGWRLGALEWWYGRLGQQTPRGSKKNI